MDTVNNDNGGATVLENNGKTDNIDNTEQTDSTVSVQSGSVEKDLTGTVAKHYNELQEAGKESRTFSRIYHLRNFNNWVKSVLIGDTLDKLRGNDRHKHLTVLDLCSGKGGDLLKWRKGGINKLVCADIAATSVEQSEGRYNEMAEKSRYDRHSPKIFEAEFIAADCTKEILKERFKDPSMLFDLTCCQFSFHYSFESQPQAEMMLRNACECLKPGGYFIGTTPNCNELVKRLRNSADNSFGNDVYKITFPNTDKSTFPLFGAKYDFHLEGVVDCPEFLVYFPLLEKLAEKYGMKLIKKVPFDEFYTEKIERGDARNLIGRMSALEPYPNEEGTDLVGTAEDDYIHAKEFLSSLESQDNSSHHHHGNRKPLKIGTLSKAEWEATTVYLVFIFQKDGGEKDMSETGESSSRKHAASDRSQEPAEKSCKTSP
ncbi:mRNA cap guanine-N7 methyltransferase [Patella vulgata]|uniref:mRNA cap guanine-N7 methyltransferase n=1 Tax=Patella vulgata TaxID=6465 RepID=UPI0024A7FB1A|nr:mRNA cap guanine-N7 methyltransferase [Patella vulgata]